MKKRKDANADASLNKKARLPCATLPLHRDLLTLFYPNCTPLRKYILASLPQASRLRRRKIESIGRDAECSAVESELAYLLDSSLVCFPQLTPDTSDTRWQEWLSFSQRGDESNVTLNGNSPIYSQSDIVDFVVWLLFSRDNSGVTGPKHLLCDGYRRGATDKTQAELIPGVFSRYPNDQVARLKASPWPQLLALLGQSGEKIMINLLVDCSVFIAVKSGLNNFYQISGNPISDLEYEIESKKDTSSTEKSRKPSEITLMRSRMFYARPPITSKGHIQPGFRHIHILNRSTCNSENTREIPSIQQKNDINTAKVMMYIFPRQFGLHNVFTSSVDIKITAHKFQDYTNRDEEIGIFLQSGQNITARGVPKIPKRLRGTARDLVRQLQIRHRRCSYFELIRHYCPSILDSLRGKMQRNKVPNSNSNSKPLPSQAIAPEAAQRPSVVGKQVTQTQHRTQASRVFQIDPSIPIVDLATSSSQVSAFFQATISRIIPDAFWGEGEDLAHNKSLFAKKIHHFIMLRKFETVNLHDLSQGFKISRLQWLQLPDRRGQKASQAETRKILEIFHELLYYVFDSLLIPLIRSTFYVTESNNHRHQVFYFRHDVWKMVSERAMHAIKDGMLEELKVADIQRSLDSKQLGFSQIRLLPKGASLRPIMNLRRRYPTKHNRKILGPSINSLLTPIYNVLKLEKDLYPSNLGATLFSVGDIYDRLKAFKIRFPEGLPRLYFVKADVQSAFDTIPQEAVLKLMMTLPSHPNYKIFKHAEVTAGERLLSEDANNVPTNGSTHSGRPLKPIRRWNRTAYPGDECSPFLDRLEESHGNFIAARQRRNTVFVNTAVQSLYTRGSLLHLLAEHVTDNHIKVGKKVYRQRQGIPQGSVLSSFLCNYFYADLERKHLGFLTDKGADARNDSLLLRLIDDFLLITTDKSKAQRFADILHQGVPEYGVQVNHKKSLVNFSMSVPSAESGAGQPVPLARVDSSANFPYCGILINCKSLEISKDCEREKNIDVSHTLTVEHGRMPGRNFERKVLHSFKIQSHLMFYDTSYNSNETVLGTLRAAFRQSALKMWAYTRSLRRDSRPRPDLVKRTITRTLEAAYLILTSSFRKMKHQGYECTIRKAQVARIAYEAFEEVLQTKQTHNGEVLIWLHEQSLNLPC